MSVSGAVTHVGLVYDPAHRLLDHLYREYVPLSPANSLLSTDLGDGSCFIAHNMTLE